MPEQVSWRPLFQRTIDAYYAGEFDEGREACERVLSLDGLPEEFRVQAMRNAAFYAPPLADWVPGLTLRPIDIPVQEGWSRFNPSICADGDGFRMILRSSNYVVSPQLDYRVRDADGIFRTVNRLVTLDGDLRVRTVDLLDDREPTANPSGFPVTGLEDCRLFPDGDGWSVIATTRQHNPNGWCQQVMMRLDGTVLRDARLLSTPDRHEKNWMPIVGMEGPSFVYLCSPTILVRVTGGTPAVEPIVTRPAPWLGERFRGGSQAVPFDGGHLCLIHEAANYDDGGRVYLHRFVWFDGEWNLARCSRPFLLKERGIEFAAGLAIQGDRAVITFGSWDREAYFAEVPLAGIRPLLLPPPENATAVDDLPLGAPAPASAVLAAARPAQPVQAETRGVGTEMLVAKAPAPAPDEVGFTPFPSLPVRIVSVTMAGNNEAIIEEGLRSVVDWVDACLLVDTGITDRTLEIAREVCGDKLVVRQFPWREDFAAARNAALGFAAELGYEWAVVLDTDERIDIRGTDVHQALSETPFDTLMMAFIDQSYEKERFFKLPARGYYVGPTHEAFINTGRRGSIVGPIFVEQPKSWEQYQRKFERDVAILQRHTAENPDDPRWWYYLADGLANLQRHEEAIEAFEKCWALRGWDEEGAWAMYRAANIWLAIGRPEKAIEACAAGMARHAELGELPWLAAYASWQLQQPLQAARWARIAVDLGVPYGRGRPETRVGFKHPPALFEGPFDVLRFALRAIGDHAGAAEAEQRFQEAAAMREGRIPVRRAADGGNGNGNGNGREPQARQQADRSAALIAAAGEAARAASGQ